ncbi:MAG: hypothetical protein AAF755_11235 [Pseudomonadota bacterium]
MARKAWILVNVMLVCLLNGCASSVPVASDLIPEYRGVAVNVIGPGLFQVVVEMTNARDGADVSDYAACAAAQFALDQGFGFARHIKSEIFQDNDVWRGDAIYTLSQTLPEGLKTLDAEVLAADCVDRGIVAIP